MRLDQAVCEGGLLYGSGLRLMEALRLQVQDVDIGMKQLTVPDRKGGKRPRYDAAREGDPGTPGAQGTGARPA